MRKIAIFAAAFAAAGLLAACGQQGQLERPDPLYGPRADKDYQQKRPVTPGENYDPASTNRSPSAAPLPSTNDPFGRPPSVTP